MAQARPVASTVRFRPVKSSAWAMKSRPSFLMIHSDYSAWMVVKYSQLLGIVPNPQKASWGPRIPSSKSWINPEVVRSNHGSLVRERMLWIVGSLWHFMTLWLTGMQPGEQTHLFDIGWFVDVCSGYKPSGLRTKKGVSTFSFRIWLNYSDPGGGPSEFSQKKSMPPKLTENQPDWWLRTMVT